jgi:hypothetical protein
MVVLGGLGIAGIIGATALISGATAGFFAGDTKQVTNQTEVQNSYSSQTSNIAVENSTIESFDFAPVLSTEQEQQQDATQTAGKGLNPMLIYAGLGVVGAYLILQRGDK